VIPSAAGRFFLALLVFAFLLPGCAAPRTAEIAWNESGVDLVWPSPPSPPRIKYLRTMSGSSDFAGEGAGSRFLRWVAGEPDRGPDLQSPYGVAADGDGLIWVADSGTHAVHAFDLARGKVTYLTNFGRERLVTPVGVAVDSQRRLLYVSDAGLGKVFAVNYKGDLQGLRLPPGGYGRPAGLSTDQLGNLYVVDVVKGVVDVFSPEGSFVRVIDGHQLEGGGFNLPSNVFVDKDGNVFVTDSMNFRIAVFDHGGEVLGAIGELGDGPGTFARPRGVAVDSRGHVFVGDAAFDNIQLFDLAGQLLLYFGSPGNGPGEFALPAGLFIDRFDRLYVADAHNHRIQIFQFLSEDP
jgi:sugar lactone lactonase YvrE